jgi:acetylornithine deacetylase/succinyl-diaminopimelate desuccinylase-like protein
VHSKLNPNLRSYGLDNAVKLACDLIAQKSTEGQERAALEVCENHLLSLGFKVERLPVDKNTYNLFVSFGRPNVVLTTHLDVVPGPDSLLIQK